MGNGAVVHAANTGGKGDDFFKFRRQQKNGDAMAAGVNNFAVYGFNGAYIHTPRWLSQYQKLEGGAGHFASNNNFLLVTS